MKIKIRYATKERKYLNDSCYQNVSKDVELDVVQVRRTPCGTGAAAERYNYHGYFSAPEDAEFVRDGFIVARIDRKSNPHFSPKKLEWTGNLYSVA